ncbi:hypothetical protein [Enterococcus gallinarum]|uniref:hypothetical protein n=1 Tax=Enterococcus gallinarum TaxID=1353 RepID=UPI00214BC62F|nr:hypothetical protein [Enterococcus gallinarum]MCR1932636.1 hypothetical protein [Enterococcus gallinarum]
MVQESILKGEEAYLKKASEDRRFSLDEWEGIKAIVEDKRAGVKLDKAIDQHARTVHAF